MMMVESVFHYLNLSVGCTMSSVFWAKLVEVVKNVFPDGAAFVGGGGVPS